MEENQSNETNQATQTTQTNETVQEKKNWFKENQTLCIIIAVIAAVAVAAVIIFMGQNGQGGSPEQILRTYVDAMKEGNADKIMNVTDIRGAYAWNKCNGDTSKFKEEYDKVSDSDVEAYKKEAKSALDYAMGLLKAFSGVEIELTNVGPTQDLGNGIQSIKGTMKMKVLGMEQDQDLEIVTYNGKYIGEK